MADIETVLYTRLTTHAGTAALISGRFYFDDVPQGAAKPYIVAQKISENPIITQDGVEALTRTAWQVDAYAETRASCKSVMAQIRLALDSYTTTGVQAMLPVNELISVYRDDSTRYVVGSIEYEIHHERG